MVHSGDADDSTIVQLTEEQMRQLAAQAGGEDGTVQVVLQGEGGGNQ